MNKKIVIAFGIALVGLVAARLATPRFALFGSAIGDQPVSAADRGLSTMLQARLSGDLTLTVIEQDSDGYRVKAELKGGQFALTPADKTDLKAALAQPFYFTVSNTGDLHSYYFAKDLPAEAREVLKQATNAFQATIPGGTASAWHATEKDVSGTYEASYTTDGATVSRTKNQYVRVRALEGLAPVDATTRYSVASQSTFELAANGWPRSISSEEAFDVDMHGQPMVVSGQVKATLSATASHPEQAQPMPAAQVESESIANEHTAAAQRLSAAKDRVNARSFEQILAEMEGKDVAARNQAQPALAALFLVEPKTIDQAVDVVLRGNHSDNLARRVLGALGGADTQATQQALVDIIRRGNEQRQTEAVATLGLVAHPAADIVAAFQQIDGRSSESVSRTTTLATGNIARRLELQNHDAAGALKLMSALLERLQQTNDPDERILALKAVGNWGTPQALTSVQPFLSSEDVDQRATAVASLRFMPGQVVDAAVISAMSDADTKVRTAAAATLQYRPVAPVLSAVEKLVKQEPSERIGLEVVAALHARRHEAAGTVDLLHWMAENHPSKEVKKAAQKALGT